MALLPRLLRGVGPVCLWLLAASLASAQGWTPVGPPGGDVRALAADPRRPQVVYLGTADGVLYRSDDAGLRWSRLTPGFPMRGRSLDDIVVDAQGDVVVGYWEVAGSGGGVARSSDGGRSFTILPGVDGQAVRALAIAPSNPRVIVAGAIAGVFRSDDGGRSWRRVSPEDHADLRNVDSVALDPADPDVIYVGTWHLAWKTVDGGRRWWPIKAGMIDDSDVMTLTLDKRSPGTIYATACSGIYRSVDGAGRWAKLKGIPSESRRTRALALDPVRPGGLYAGTTQGLWATEDGGGRWVMLTPRSLVVNSIVILPDGTVLLGCDGAGVLRSSDRGRTWMASNEGFSERFVSRMVFDTSPSTPEGGGPRVLAGILGDRQHGGVLVAPDPDGPWRRLGLGLEGREVLSLALAGRQPIAGTDDGVFAFFASGPADPRAPATPGVWKRIPMAVDGFDVHPRVADLVALAPSTPPPYPSPTGYSARASPIPCDQARASQMPCTYGGREVPRSRLSTQRSRLVLLVATSQGLLVSRDGGESWGRVNLGLARAVSALSGVPGEPSSVLAATPLGVFESQDAGETWAQVSPGLGEAGIHGLAFLPGSDRVLFATTSSGLFKSPDRGRTWQRRGGGLPYSDITGLALHPDGRTLYASDFTRGGVFRSVDGGDLWAPFRTDGLASDRVWALALDPTSPGRLVAASPTGGLHLLSLAPPGVSAGSP